jgi:hypothetical protein
VSSPKAYRVGVDAARDHGTLSTGWWWAARFVASLSLLLGVLVFTSFAETGHLILLAMAILGVGGALVFAFGIERPDIGRHDRPGSWAG